MARRSPARVRAATHRRLNQTGPRIPRLSRRSHTAIAPLERGRLWPGAAHEALDAWTDVLRDPYHRLFDPAYGCGVLACCPDPIELRRILHTVIHVLPRHDARALRRRLADLDDQW